MKGKEYFLVPGEVKLLLVSVAAQIAQMSALGGAITLIDWVCKEHLQPVFTQVSSCISKDHRLMYCSYFTGQSGLCCRLCRARMVTEKCSRVSDVSQVNSGCVMMDCSDHVSR